MLIAYLKNSRQQAKMDKHRQKAAHTTAALLSSCLAIATVVPLRKKSTTKVPKYGYSGGFGIPMTNRLINAVAVNPTEIIVLAHTNPRTERSRRRSGLETWVYI